MIGYRPTTANNRTQRHQPIRKTAAHKNRKIYSVEKANSPPALVHVWILWVVATSNPLTLALAVGVIYKDLGCPGGLFNSSESIYEWTVRSDFFPQYLRPNTAGGGGVGSGNR